MARPLRYLPLLLTLLAGCASIRTTDPPRTASEQYLLTEAALRAADGLDVSMLRNRQVFLDTTYVAGGLSAEQTFAVGELRARLMLAGARLAATRDKAQVIVELRSEAIGIDRWDNLLGIPSIAVPNAITSTGQIPLATPELALMKSVKQHGYATLAFVAYWADTGEVLASSGPSTGRTIREDFWFLGIGPRSSGNIPTTDHPKSPPPPPETVK